MEASKEDWLRTIYNLILTPGTRKWERERLIFAKESLENRAGFKEQLAQLEVELRPLALRNNLTPDVAEFYLRITNDSTDTAVFDSEKHTSVDFSYQERAIFSGGCFWCMVEPFEIKAGIISVLSGYIGGELSHPTYDQVSGGYTGHVEAVEIIFDMRAIRYEELVDLYWQLTDPTDDAGQFQDRGKQYKPIIFVQNEQQRKIAEASKQKLIDSGKYSQPIVTEIREAAVFWPAENYHQQFYQKYPKRYKKIKRARQQLLFYQHVTSWLRLKFKKSKN